jgi:hypothetical protein
MKDCKRNEGIRKEPGITHINNIVHQKYQNKGLEHLKGMPENRIQNCSINKRKYRQTMRG